jgi:uncharacterized protein YjbI with pentapeptide repeats
MYMPRADFYRANLTDAVFQDADLTGASFRAARGLATVTWTDVTCPDGTNSDVNGGTCLGHLDP